MALSAFGLWLWSVRSGEAPGQATDASAVRSTLHLETFVLNVGGAGQSAYLRVGIELGLSQDAKRAQGVAAIPQIRDTILEVLSGSNADDLLTSSGKTKLKRDLLRALQERVPAVGAEQVYFTEFLVQR